MWLLYLPCATVVSGISMLKKEPRLWAEQVFSIDVDEILRGFQIALLRLFQPFLFFYLSMSTCICALYMNS